MPQPSASIRSLAAAALLTLAAATTVAAYAGQVAATITATSPAGNATCGVPFAVEALIEDVEGSPIADQPVQWSFGLGSVSGDRIADATTTSGADGVATTEITLACAEAHQVTLLITADDIEGSIVLATVGDSLPRTDTAALGPSSSLPGILAAAVAVLVGSGAILHRFATGRR